MFKLVLKMPRNQRSNYQHPLHHQKSKRVPEKKKNLHSIYWLHQSLWLWWITTNCGKFFERWEHNTRFLLRNLYAGQEVKVRTRHGTMDSFQIGKGIHQGCILSPCLFILYSEYILQNNGLDETQAGIKIAGRNVNNLIYSDDTNFMEESKEELNLLLMKVKEESENVGLKLNIQKLRSWHPVPSFHGK